MTILTISGVPPTTADTYAAAAAERAAEQAAADAAASAAAADAAASAAAADALRSLSARVLRVAATVAEQAALHRQLVGLDWHGSAATLFKDAVHTGASELAALVRRLEDLSEEALRRASLVGGSPW